MSTSTPIGFDIAGLVRALEERDVTAQLELYADDAEVTLMDKDHPPARPHVLSGKDEIRAWVEDICSRDMTHRVERQVAGPDGAAFTEACRYPDETRVLRVTLLELKGGLIKRQTGVQAWDESSSSLQVAQRGGLLGPGTRGPTVGLRTR